MENVTQNCLESGMSDKTEKKSIAQIIKETCEEMCNNFCKYPEKGLTDEELEKICEGCPLDNLN